MDGELALGFVLALAAACCYETGYALQAVEARRAPAERALRPSLVAHLVRRPVWLGATALSLVGWPLQIAALTEAPLTLVQPTLALGLLLLLVLGVRILGEHVGTREIVAVAMIIASVGVFAWAAPRDTGDVERGAGLVVALSVLIAVALVPTRSPWEGAVTRCAPGRERRRGRRTGRLRRQDRRSGRLGGRAGRGRPLGGAGGRRRDRRTDQRVDGAPELRCDPVAPRCS